MIVELGESAKVGENRPPFTARLKGKEVVTIAASSTSKSSEVPLKNA